jgi:thiamine-phosphate pyrophosphorylase
MGSAASACALYLVLPPKLTAAFDNVLTKVLAEASPACLLLPHDATLELGARLREATAAREIALLVEHDVERAAQIAADGVHLPPDAGRFKEARERLGERAIVGIGCIESRHDAMVMAETGADYVGFAAIEEDHQAELIAWWAEIFVVPSVAFDVKTPVAAARLAGLGADFVAPAVSVWDGDDALARISEFADSLSIGRSAA